MVIELGVKMVEGLLSVFRGSHVEVGAWEGWWVWRQVDKAWGEFGVAVADGNVPDADYGLSVFLLPCQRLWRQGVLLVLTPHGLEVKVGSGAFMVPGQQVPRFAPPLIEGELMVVDWAWALVGLRSLVKQVSRPGLEQVACQQENGFWELVATDGYRLVIQRCTGPAADAGLWTVPAVALAALERCLRHFDSIPSLYCHLDERFLTLQGQAEGVRWWWRTCIGREYINFRSLPYLQLFPQVLCRLPKTDLVAAIERLLIINESLTFYLNAADMQIHATTSDKRGEETLPPDYLAPPAKSLLVTCNGKLLLEVLQLISTPNVHLGVFDPDKPLLILPEGSRLDTTPGTHLSSQSLLMPILKVP